MDLKERLEADRQTLLGNLIAEHAAMTREMAEAKIEEYQETIKEIRRNMKGDDLRKFHGRYRKRIARLRKIARSDERNDRYGGVAPQSERHAAELEQAVHFRDDPFTQKMLAFAEKVLEK